MDPFSLGDGCKIDLDAVEFDPTDAVNKLLGSGTPQSRPDALYHTLAYIMRLLFEPELQILTQRKSLS